MERRRRAIGRWILTQLIVLAIGFAAGFYVRDRHYGDLRAQYQEIQERYEASRAELEQLRSRSVRVIEEGREAGAEIQEVLEDSTP
jgi:hypothetical protein